MCNESSGYEGTEKAIGRRGVQEDSMQKVFVETKFSSPAAKGSPPLTRRYKASRLIYMRYNLNNLQH